MKKLILIVITILISLTLPFNVFAQNSGKCTGAESGSFTDWKTCLGGSSNSSDNGGIKINEGFINNAYQSFYNYAKSYLCGTDKEKQDLCASNFVLNKLALDIFAIIIAIMALVFVLLLFRSRFMYITAGDNEDQVKKAKKISTAAILGFVIVFWGIIVGEIAAISLGTHLTQVLLFSN